MANAYVYIEKLKQDDSILSPDPYINESLLLVMYQICTPKSTNFFKRKQPSWVLTKGIHSPFGNHETFQVLTIGEPLTRYQVLRQSTKYPKVPKY